MPVSAAFLDINCTICSALVPSPSSRDGYEATSTMLRASKANDVRKGGSLSRRVIILKNNNLRLAKVLGHGLVKRVLYVLRKTTFARVGLAIDNEW